MKVAVEKQENHLALINLEIPAEHAVQEYNKACRRIGQRLNIPGFRRGKAPRGIIEKTVGTDRIKQEAMDRLLPHAFADAISEHQLDVVAPPQITNYKFELSDGIQIKAQVELRPEVTLPEQLSFHVKYPEFVTAPEVEAQELQTIVERLTTLEPVIDRPATDNDIVSIDFTGSINGELIRGGAAKNYRLDLANNNFIEGFAQQLVGHSIGEEFQIQVTFPEDYHDNALAGKLADFQIKVNDIKKRVVPELTDELAKKAGPYESLDHLKQEVRRLLDLHQEQENTFRKQKALIDEMVKQSTVEIPDAMINREAKMLMEEVRQRFKGQGASWEEFLDSQGHETIWENLRNEARTRIKTSLVFGAVAKRENVSVTEDEFETYLKELSQMRNTEEKALMRQLANNPNALQALNDQLLAQKMVDKLLQQATFEAVAEEVTPEKSESEEAPSVPVPATMEGEEFEVIEES